jgi:hypothetical protein
MTMVLTILKKKQTTAYKPAVSLPVSFMTRASSLRVLK